MNEFLNYSTLSSEEIFCISIARIDAAITIIIVALGLKAILQDNEMDENVHKGGRDDTSGKRIKEMRCKATRVEQLLLKIEVETSVCFH